MTRPRVELRGARAAQQEQAMLGAVVALAVLGCILVPEFFKLNGTKGS